MVFNHYHLLLLEHQGDVKQLPVYLDLNHAQSPSKHPAPQTVSPIVLDTGQQRAMPPMLQSQHGVSCKSNPGGNAFNKNNNNI